jgi:hypothetical protein
MLISKIYREKKKTEIPLETLNSIYSRSEFVFYKLLDKLALMQKLILEEEGPQVRRNQLHIPSLNPQNSSSVILAASTLRVDESVLLSLRKKFRGMDTRD